MEAELALLNCCDCFKGKCYMLKVKLSQNLNRVKIFRNIWTVIKLNSKIKYGLCCWDYLNLALVLWFLIYPNAPPPPHLLPGSFNAAAIATTNSSSSDALLLLLPPTTTPLVCVKLFLDNETWKQNSRCPTSSRNDSRRDSRKQRFWSRLLPPRLKATHKVT